MWLIIDVPGCVLLLRDDGYSSRFHLVVFNAIALVVHDTYCLDCLVTYDGIVTRLRRVPRTPPRGVGVVHLGQRVPELSFVLNDEAGSEVEAAALEVIVERVVVVGRLISSAAVVDVLTWGALRASEDQDRG
ncbi:MAG: hypothetical protein NZ847_00605 [Acidobacteria bacterium]|nr:hypothetical protein [Acidobacteriota bacterium]